MSLDSAYMAGIIDGEGSVTAVRQEKAGRMTHYVVRVTVTNTYEPLMRAIHEQFCGELRLHHRNHERWADCWRWAATSRGAERLLREVLPYLIIKREQAVLCLRLRETMTDGHGVGISPEVVGERLAIYEQLRDLNRRGP